MREIERSCIEKLLAMKELENGNRITRELLVAEENIADSTLDIWCEKDVVPHPKLTQYEIYKCFILRFELAFSGFVNPVVDLFHYTLKDIAFCDKIEGVTESNIEQCYRNGMVFDKHTSSEFVKLTTFDNGEWYIRY